MLSLRMSGALRFSALCENGSRALLGAKNAQRPRKKRTPGSIWCWIAPPKKADNTVSKPVGLHAPRPGERQPVMPEEAARGFSQQATALGNVPPALGPLMASENSIVKIKAPRRDPHLAALASEANRVAKGTWTGSAWEQRMSIMRRLGEFEKKHGLEIPKEHVPLFIVGLKLAESSAVQCAGAPSSLMGAGNGPAQTFLPGRWRAAAENPPGRARPMMLWEPDLVCNAMVSERGRVAVRLAWATAGSWDEIALLLKENFIDPPSDHSALIVDRGALPKTFEADPHRAARCMAIAGADAFMSRVVEK
ncbi:hypothetical protein TRVL_08646 [Trypanosoma vivax]|nr:hypothetical protein TRVL_08646 [Trypanosoma vivax]